MTQSKWTFGGSSECDVWIPLPTVSAVHCQLRKLTEVESTDRNFELTDLGSTNGTYLDSQRISGPVKIKSDSRVTLGTQVVLPWPDDEGAAAVVCFGRAPDNDIVIDAASVSSHHGRIILGPRGTLIVEDLDSTNGIGLSVGGEVTRIRHAALIDYRCTLMLGTHPVSVSTIITPSTLALASATATGKPQPEPAASSPTASTRLAANEATAQTAQTQVRLAPLRWSTLAAGVALVMLLAIVLLMFVAGRKQTSAIASSDGANPSLSTSMTDGNAGEASAVTVASQQTPQGALFWVLVASQDGSLTFRVGNAFAVSDSRLVTSGSIVRAVESLAAGEYPQHTVVHLQSGSRYTISELQPHPISRPRIDEANRLRQQYETELSKLQTPQDGVSDLPEGELDRDLQQRKASLVELGERMLRAEQQVIDFDVGWIELSTKLASQVTRLALQTTQPARPKQKLTLIAAPFDLEDPYFDPEMPAEFVDQSMRVSTVLTLPDQAGHRLTLQEAWRPGAVNLFGCPLIDPQSRVVGVISRNEMLSPEITHVDAVGASVLRAFLGPGR